MTSSLINHELGVQLPTVYQEMVASIHNSLPAIDAAMVIHGKARSQFQVHSIDMGGPTAGYTKIRNARRVLAEIEQTRAALEESSFKMKKIQIRAAKFREQAKNKTGFDAQLCLVSAMELEAQAKRIQTAIFGAVRKLLNLVEQHKHLESLIRKELGKADNELITEADFEADEERFHIKKVFEQSLCASRSLGRPQIDHGDYIYLWDLGINGRCAQIDLAEFWHAEQMAIENSATIDELRTLELNWLEKMAERYCGCAMRSAEAKGLLTNIPEALIK